MQAGITYVHHNCFVLELDRQTLLFDYPEDRYLPPGAADLVRQRIAGAELYVFVSHGHADHFNKDLVRVVAPASRSWFIVSDDVFDMFPEAAPKDALIVEPDEEYLFQGMTIRTLMANDLGVAFIIETKGIVIYFGGDLAEWIWPDMTPAAVRFTENYFQQILDMLKERRIHIAFSNLDKRLENLGGGMKFLSQVQPVVFVPMHSFGDTDWAAMAEHSDEKGASRVFRYRKTGDAMTMEINP